MTGEPPPDPQARSAFGVARMVVLCGDSLTLLARRASWPLSRPKFV